MKNRLLVYLAYLGIAGLLITGAVLTLLPDGPRVKSSCSAQDRARVREFVKDSPHKFVGDPCSTVIVGPPVTVTIGR